MKPGDAAAVSAWLSIEDTVDGSFALEADENVMELPGFFEQTFSNPFVTISYPLPFETMVFYQAKVYPDIVRMAGETLYWNYRGTTQDSGDTWSVYSEYWFTMSQPMQGKKYFMSR